MKTNFLPEKKKKVHITPAQQMLKRFEALQKSSSCSSNAAVKQPSSVASGAAMKQSASRTDASVSAADNITKVPCATKPKLGSRVAHKPAAVRQFHLLVLLVL